MLKVNPITITIDYIQFYVQKFVLHMLDHYGILVSRWAWSLIAIDIAFFLYSVITKTTLDSLQSILFIGPILFIIMIAFAKQASRLLEAEKTGQYKTYNFHRSKYDKTWIKVVFVVLALIFLPVEINKITHDITLLDIVRFCYRRIDDFFIFFLACYTRDREPPAKTNLSFAN